MTLRKKTILLITITIVCLVTVLHITSTRVLLKSFENVEAQNTRENLQRVREFYNDELTELNVMNGDWAEWDLTYNFMKQSDNAYIAENLNDATLVRGNIDLIAYISNQQQLVFGKTIEPKQQQSSIIPLPLQQYLTRDRSLSRSNKQHAGIVLLPTGAMIITTRSIFNSEGTGASPGVLFMGRYLNIEQLAQQTHIELATQEYNVLQMPPDFLAAR